MQIQAVPRGYGPYGITTTPTGEVWGAASSQHRLVVVYTRWLAMRTYASVASSSSRSFWRRSRVGVTRFCTTPQTSPKSTIV